MKKIISLAIISFSIIAYAKGSIRSNATNCFVKALDENVAANPGKTHYLKDVKSQLPKIADCTEHKNSFIANILFDKAEIGNYIRIGKP